MKGYVGMSDGTAGRGAFLKAEKEGTAFLVENDPMPSFPRSLCPIAYLPSKRRPYFLQADFSDPSLCMPGAAHDDLRGLLQPPPAC